MVATGVIQGIYGAVFGCWLVITTDALQAGYSPEHLFEGTEMRMMAVYLNLMTSVIYICFMCVLLYREFYFIYVLKINQHMSTDQLDVQELMTQNLEHKEADCLDTIECCSASFTVFCFIAYACNVALSVLVFLDEVTNQKIIFF